MKALLAKLEILVDEVTGLVREERTRRANPFGIGYQPPTLYGPRGTEFKINPLEITCSGVAQ